MRKPLVIRRLVKSDCVITIELRQYLPWIAFVFFLFWYIASPTKIAAMALFSLAAILGIAYAWAAILATRISGQRKLRYGALQVGDELEEEVTLKNSSALPVLWAEFLDRSNIPEYTVSSVRAADSNETARWRARAVCSQRGLYILGPWELHMGDVFGIYRVRQVYLQKQEILVYPPLAELPEQMIPQSGVQGDERPLHQPIRAETIVATSARPYVDGDPLRHIHWKTSARKNTIFVKQFEPEAATSVWIIPDCDMGVHLGQGSDSSFETMILVAASLAARLIKAQMAVGLFCETDDPVVLAPLRGQQQLWDILRALAPLQPQFGHPLSAALEKARKLVTAHNLLVVITPSVQPDWLPGIHHLAGVRGRRRAEVILLDPLSFGGNTKADLLLPVLSESGITGRVLERGQIHAMTASYGDLSRWEFKDGATGRAILRHKPREAGLSPLPTGQASYRQWKDQP